MAKPGALADGHDRLALLKSPGWSEVASVTAARGIGMSPVESAAYTVLLQSLSDFPKLERQVAELQVKWTTAQSLPEVGCTLIRKHVLSINGYLGS